MEKIRWGIIGVGDVTEKKSGPAFSKVKDSALTAVMRRSAGKAEDYAKRHGVPKWYSDAGQLIADPDVNAVYIATPPASHKDYTLMAAAAGKPVYVEKPMALNFHECREMIDACSSAKVPLYVAYYRRRLPAFVKVKELLDEKAVGDVRFIRVLHFAKPEIDLKTELPWRVLPELSGGGIFIDMGSHTIDILDYLLGPVTKAQGIASNQAGLYPAEDIAAANFEFESGALGTGLWCFTAADNREEIEIVGSRGRIQFTSYGKPAVVLTTAKGVRDFSFENPENIQQPLIQTVVDDLLGRGTCLSTGESGARATWVMDQVLKDWREKKG